MPSKDILFFGKNVTVSCDGNCSKAWGINSRPRLPDDSYIPDDKLGTAPVDPGTYEGRDCKPTSSEHYLNRWCVRECERSKLTDKV